MQLLTPDERDAARFAGWWSSTAADRSVAAGLLGFHAVAFAWFSLAPSVEPASVFLLGAVSGGGSVAAWLLRRTGGRPRQDR